MPKFHLETRYDDYEHILKLALSVQISHSIYKICIFYNHIVIQVCIHVP